MLRTLLAVVVMGSFLTGCVFIEGHSYGAKADIEFFWTLNGAKCRADPYVQSIHIRIPGEVLQNDGYYPCAQGGVQGIVLEDFRPGTYSYVVEALDFYGQPLYRASGSFHIDGHDRNNYLQVYVDLLPIMHW